MVMLPGRGQRIPAPGNDMGVGGARRSLPSAGRVGLGIMLTAALIVRVTPSLRATYRTVRSEVRLARAGGFLPFSRLWGSKTS